jgi:hypothetical protein
MSYAVSFSPVFRTEYLLITRPLKHLLFTSLSAKRPIHKATLHAVTIFITQSSHHATIELRIPSYTLISSCTINYSGPVPWSLISRSTLLIDDINIRQYTVESLFVDSLLSLVLLTRGIDSVILRDNIPFFHFELNNKWR